MPGKFLRLLGWPLRWLWRFIGRLGMAERRILEAIWRFLGRLGIALRNILTWVGSLFWRPIRWLLVSLGRPVLAVSRALLRRLGTWGVALRRKLTPPILAIWRAVQWTAPYVWEELGRLGLALYRLIAILTWPVARPATVIWRRVLGPPLVSLCDRITLRAMVTGRALRSKRRIQAARRQVRLREKLASNYSGPMPTSSGRRWWIRAVAALAALNLVLLVLLARALTYYRQPAEARLGVLSTPEPTSTPTPLRLPTGTPIPTAIPITPAPPPDPLATGGSVAFVLRQNGGEDIYAITAGQEQPVRLTDHQADDRSPAWSPDGTRLAFASRRDGNWELYVLDIADGSLTRLTRDIAFDGRPSWSPDGRWLVFESYQQENLDIYIMPVDGGDPVRLTTNPAADYAPVWAPSGRHIAFVSRRSGSPDIYLLGLDDARDEVAVNISQSPEVEEDQPSWHPGGDYLAFSGTAGSQQLIYIQPMLNNLPSDDPVVIGQGYDSAWAPSGNALVYVHDDGNRRYLLASGINGWEAAPQVYLSECPLSSPAWSSRALPPGLLVAESLGLSALDAPAGPTGMSLYEETMANPVEEGAPFTLVTLDDIQAPGPYLNDRVDDSFLALRERVIREAGWDFLGALDKMWEPMDAVPPPGLDSRSWHKAGRAFDLISDLNVGHHPVIEVVKEPMGAKTWWHVYVRTERQDGSQGEPLHRLPWNFQARYSGNISDYENGGRAKASIPPGYFIDFTELAADYGWERVPAGDTWRTFFPATLFWHFEKRQGLDWESAMLELYTDKDLREGFGPTAKED
jgi:TolB protein